MCCLLYNTNFGTPLNQTIEMLDGLVLDLTQVILQILNLLSLGFRAVDIALEISQRDVYLLFSI